MKEDFYVYAYLVYGRAQEITRCSYSYTGAEEIFQCADACLGWVYLALALVVLILFLFHIYCNAMRLLVCRLIYDSKLSDRTRFSGLIADIDIESEKYRWMGSARMDFYVCSKSISSNLYMLNFSIRTYTLCVVCY